jgi:hypothetical protein
MLTALSRRHFSKAELAAGNGHEVTRDLPEEVHQAADVFDDEPGPRTWSDEQIQSVVARLRGPQGDAIVDRRHLLCISPVLRAPRGDRGKTRTPLG